MFRLSVINELDTLKEKALGTVPEFTWKGRGKLSGTLLRIEGIWTEAFALHRHLEYVGGNGVN